MKTSLIVLCIAVYCVVQVKSLIRNRRQQGRIQAEIFTGKKILLYLNRSTMKAQLRAWPTQLQEGFITQVIHTFATTYPVVVPVEIWQGSMPEGGGLPLLSEGEVLIVLTMLTREEAAGPSYGFVAEVYSSAGKLGEFSENSKEEDESTLDLGNLGAGSQLDRLLAIFLRVGVSDVLQQAAGY